MARQKGTTEKPSTNGTAPTAEAERLPAYFLSLTLENVRCFGPKQTLDLSDGKGKPARWTIILGLNGTGKTTLLQSLAGFEILHTQSAPNPNYASRFLYHFSDYSTLVRGANGPEYQLTAEVALTRAIQDAPIRVTNWLHSAFESGRHLESSEEVFQAWGTPWCCAYGAGRRVGTAGLGEAAETDPTATLFSDRVALRNPETWLLELDYAAKTLKNKDTQNRLAQVKELLLSIMPEGEITDIRLTTSGGTHPKAWADFQTPYGWVPLRQLGYGYQTLITWVADLANRMAERYPDSKNPLAEPAVVLVDEIDLHLHPQWQRKLMSFLTERFPNTQFIATAHSPLVAQAAADANLAVLRREGDHVVIDNEVDNIRNWRIDQILTSDLFGLETARPPHVEEWLAERDKLLEKSKKSAAEKKRLEELNALVDELPFGETAQERKERDAIKSALDVLMKERKPAS